MPTILELATEAGVSADQVLRVVQGEPVSEDVEARVRAAMDVLGRPAYPPPALPAPRVEPVLPVEAARDGLLERFAEAAAELEATLPAEVGTVVYEALRVEVRPVAENVAGLQTLFDGLAAELRRLRHELASERRERVEDLALQVELLRTGWEGVDRRLGRIERALSREREPREPRPSTLTRIEERPPAVAPPPSGANGSRSGNGSAPGNGASPENGSHQAA